MYRAYTEIALQWVTSIQILFICALHILSISDSCILIKAYSFAIDRSVVTVRLHIQIDMLRMNKNNDDTTTNKLILCYISK